MTCRVNFRFEVVDQYPAVEVYVGFADKNRRFNFRNVAYRPVSLSHD